MRNPHAAGAGASNRLDSRDEVSTRKIPETQSPVDPIDTFMPWCSPDEKALRKRLRWTHHSADARAKRSPSGEARNAFWLAAQTASEWTTKAASKQKLWLVLHTCSQLLMAGNNYEIIEGGDA